MTGVLTGGPAGGGGHSDTKWVPTAKQTRRVESVNTKIEGWSTPLKAKKRGGGGNFKL